MAEFLGGEEKIVSKNKPHVFVNHTTSSFDVDMGVVFHKSGIYKVSLLGKRTIVSEITGSKDLAPVVRCPMCKYFRNWCTEEEEYECVRGGLLSPGPDDFCSRGERKE